MRALLSVSDKTGLVDFARSLTDRGCELISTGGTANVLKKAGLAVTAVAQVTGFPEMLDGRVKTLHPAVAGGILARRTRPDDLEALARHGIGLIDVVVVNLYPFAQAAARPDTAFDALVEEIDIGGPTLVRAASKNFQDVVVLVDPMDYAQVLVELARPEGPSLAFRFDLARKAFAHTAAYDDTIATVLSSVTCRDGRFERAPIAAPEAMPGRVKVELQKIRDLRYGENPHQRAAWYAYPGPTGLGRASILQGKELSFTNLLDLDAALRIVAEFDEPAAVIIKHTNPCGVATGAGPTDAYVRAREADPLSAFGGIVGLNRAVDAATARAITSTFIEAVVAPAVETDARSILAAKKAMRVVTVDWPVRTQERGGERELRSILGAVLAQERDFAQEAGGRWGGDVTSLPSGLRVATKRAPTHDEWTALQFAWRVCTHVKSNAVIFTRADRTVAIGAGQMSRVDAVNVAVMKAKESLVGTVAASDAFFPFRDGLDALASAGATAVIQPGGSVRDAEVVAAADEHNLAMVFTGRRHFRH